MVVTCSWSIWTAKRKLSTLTAPRWLPVDCRYCWHKKGCSIKDGMRDIYQKIEEADNIVLASPMYFHSITGGIKGPLIDRPSGVLGRPCEKRYAGTST